MLIIADLLPRFRRPDFGDVWRTFSNGIAAGREAEASYPPVSAAARHEAVSR